MEKPGFQHILYQDINVSTKDESYSTELDFGINEKIELLGNFGCWEYNIGTKIFRASKGTRAILDLNKAKLTLDDVKPLKITDFLENLDKTICAEFYFTSEFEVINKSNKSATYQSIASYKIYEQRIFGVIQNIETQKSLRHELLKERERAETSERLKNLFFSNMSHEIRTPMNGIVGFSNLLLQENLDTQTKKSYVELLEISCHQLLGIIADIIEISRIDSSLVIPDVSRIDFKITVRDVVNSFRPDLDSKKLEIKMNLGQNPNINIFSDEAKVRRILTALVDNAIKFTSSGYIEIGYKKAGCFHEIYIKDTGTGIPEAAQQHIFERFNIVEVTDSNNLHGTGLGLAISKLYISMLGGTIWFESESGKGSTFYFTLPEKDEKK